MNKGYFGLVLGLIERYVGTFMTVTKTSDGCFLARFRGTILCILSSDELRTPSVTLERRLERCYKIMFVSLMCCRTHFHRS